MLGGHFTTNIDLGYKFRLSHCGLKEGRVGITLYNIFSAKFDNNGLAAPTYERTANGIRAVNYEGPRDCWGVGFAPSAPFNVMAHLSLDF